jgi:hypothetical protein
MCTQYFITAVSTWNYKMTRICMVLINELKIMRKLVEKLSYLFVIWKEKLRKIMNIQLFHFRYPGHISKRARPI